MRKNLIKQGFAVIIIVLFICMSITTSIGTRVVKKPTIHTTNGKTLYVGGSGPGNYTSIQDAINDANPDFTVFVYAYSSPYYENVVVNKTINLIGENKETTIIDGNHSGNCVYVTADYVNISGFTIQNGRFWGIYMQMFTVFNRITGNNILNNDDAGITLYYSLGNTIIGNTISNNLDDGIHLYYSSHNTLIGNTISNNLYDGIQLYYSFGNTIKGNVILKNSNDGIRLGLRYGGYCSYNTITDNNITSNHDIGIELYQYTDNNIIYHNNFVDNTQNAYDSGNNTWDDGEYGNYWSDYEGRYPDAKQRILKPWMWDTPYKIEGGDAKDNSPLIKQWPKLKSRAISRNTASYSFYWLRFLERFPFLERLLSNSERRF